MMNSDLTPAFAAAEASPPTTGVAGSFTPALTARFA